MRGVLSEDVLPRMSLPRGVANSASTMTYYLLLMLGLMVALAAAGFEVSQLALVLGALSVGIGFGLQTVVNNFVSGLILMFERPIQPGDTVELSGTVGTVRDIGMRATTFTTFEGADVVVPNGMLLSEKLINWTLSTNTRRIDIPVGVAYGSDPERVRALLTEVAQRTERCRNPAAARGAVHRLRRQLAGFQRACLDPFRRLSHRAQRARPGHPRRAGRSRHRDPVPAAGTAPEERRPWLGRAAAGDHMSRPGGSGRRPPGVRGTGSAAAGAAPSFAMGAANVVPG